MPSDLETVCPPRAVAVELGPHSSRFDPAERLRSGLTRRARRRCWTGLERAGQVRRARGRHDRRKVVVEVTDRAVEPARTFSRPLIERSLELLRGYDDHRRTAIRDVLDGVRQAAAEGAHTPPAGASQREPGHRTTR
ncbi:MarR family transcriptional regulator [Streptomyces sp. NPDC001093]|uniref:MarR family transcriptional regulator n=1 Tax=Streptomyces sp. NPDC001093 TaxID=3154376 RepID=UPI00332EE19E